MKVDNYQLVTVADRPELAEAIDQMVYDVWPRYVTQGEWRGYSAYVPDWYGTFRRWPHLQFGLFAEDGEMVACANGLSFAWDGTPDSLHDAGWDWVMDQGRVDFEAGRTPNTFVGLSASIPTAHQGKGLAISVVRGMHLLTQEAGLTHLIVPVRPNFKDRYPLIPIDEYITWTNAQGLPFDPWMRVHARLGARVLKPCPRAMTIGGHVADWEAWTGVALPGNGEYTLPDLLTPLVVDRAADRGVYVEPNVWVEHRVK